MQAPYLFRFSPGIPTYTGRQGRYVWQPGKKPQLLLHNDWDVFWVQQGEATWELRDGRKYSAGVDEFAILPPFVPSIRGSSDVVLNPPPTNPDATQ